ncbi:hypothetical protein FQZ97_883580 [compost metagenome]
MQPEGDHQPAAGAAGTLPAQAHQHHAECRRQAEGRPEQIRLPLPVEACSSHLRQKGGGNDVAQAYQTVSGEQRVQGSWPLLPAGLRIHRGSRLRRGQQRMGDKAQHQGQGSERQPECRGAISLQIEIQGQESGQHHPKGGPGEHQAAQARPVGFGGDALAETGYHHQYPGAGHTQAEAQQDMGPESVGRHRH